MLDKVSVSRRALDFEDYISILKRNWRWMLGPAFLGLVLSTVTAYLLKDTYVSQATIRIVPQQISPEVVPNITAEDVADRINGMAQQIESRPILQSIIQMFNLYPKETKTEPMQDVVDHMRGSISIRPVESVMNPNGKTLPAMAVAFAYQNPATARKVCDEIVSRFMNASTEESLGVRRSADAFLNEQYSQAKRELDAAEQKLADFRTKYAGRLPEEVNTNLAQMGALQQRGASVGDNLARLAEQRMMLDSQLRMAQDRLAAAKEDSPQAQMQNQKVASLDREIEQLEGAIADMRRRYTEDYPDLQSARDRLQMLRTDREAAAKEKPKPEDNSLASAAIAKERAEAQNVVNQIQLQIKANDMEQQRLKRADAQVNSGLQAFEGRLQELPAGEKEYEDLLRDRDLIKQRYQEFEVKRQRSASSIQLELSKQGETLELLEPASMPSAPAKPKRQTIIPMGALIGLGLGVVMVGIREMKDTSLKSLKDARLYSQLSVLGSIPLLENHVIVQRRKQVLWVSWALATFAGLLIMAGSIAHYYLSKA